MAIRATKILQDKIKYGDFMNTATPVQTNTPKNAIPGQSALGKGLYGQFLQRAANAGARTYAQGVLPTYGEFMAQKSAENAASDIVTGNVQPRTTYAGNMGGAGGAAIPTARQTTYAENMEGKTVREMIAEQRNITYAQAAADRERATIDARTAYAQNRTTYGANAEALAEMGMQGSGYGDYLEGAAYAQQRADIQAARAGEIAAQREADRVYYADMMAQTEKENAAYLTLLDAAKGGMYTADEIRAAAEKQGITNAADLNALTKAAGTAKTEAEKVEKETAGDEIQAMLDAKDIAGADRLVDEYYKNGLYNIDDYQGYHMQKYISAIDNAGTATELGDIVKNISKAEQEGDISSEDYKNIINYLRSNSLIETGLYYKINGIDSADMTLHVTMDGKTYNVHTSNVTDKATKEALNKMGVDKQNGKLVAIGNTIYTYWDKGNRWLEVITGGNSKFLEKYFSEVKENKTSIPEHTAVVGPTSGKTTYRENMVVGPTK